MIIKKEFPKAVRIKVNKDMIVQMFSKSKYPIICREGLPKGYKVIGIIQDLNGMFEFILATDKAEEGQITEEFMPLYERIDCLNGTKVKDKLFEIFKTDIQTRDYLCKELGLLTLEKYPGGS